MGRKLTPRRAYRKVMRAGLDFSQVEDPREARGKRYELPGILQLMVTALALGRRQVRRMEDLATDIARSTGGRPKRSISDSALYALLGRLSPQGLRHTLRSQVSKLLRTGKLRHDAFKGRVLSIDGKTGSSGAGPPPCTSCRTTGDDKGHHFWYDHSLRAVLTSSQACPVLDVQAVEPEDGEATSFAPLFERVVEHYDKHFDHVTADAAMTSVANARRVLRAGKNYLFALKENQHRLYESARQLLTTAPVSARTHERVNGKRVERSLRVVPVPEGESFPGASQYLTVRHRCTHPTTGEVLHDEERQFVTSAPANLLPPNQLLALVRLHWRIENGHNLAADIVLEEDTTSPCNKGQAPLVVCLLRLLAYNLLACMRTLLPKRDRRAPSYKRVQDLLYQHALGLPVLTGALATLL